MPDRSSSKSGADAGGVFWGPQVKQDANLENGLGVWFFTLSSIERRLDFKGHLISIIICDIGSSGLGEPEIGNYTTF